MAGRQDKAGRRGASFDALDVARRGASFAGSFDARSLARTADRLAPGDDAAALAWRVTGMADASGRPALEVRLDGTVQLVCQRCLQPFAWRVAQRTVLMLARDERELEMLDAEDEHEVILAAPSVDAATLAEDELLLTLPFAPRCERRGCAGSTTAVAIDKDTAAAKSAGTSAFAALASLKAAAAKKTKD
jgi:uncharacterized protein